MSDTITIAIDVEGLQPFLDRFRVLTDAFAERMASYQAIGAQLRGRPVGPVCRPPAAHPRRTP